MCRTRFRLTGNSDSGGYGSGSRLRGDSDIGRSFGIRREQFDGLG